MTTLPNELKTLLQKHYETGLRKLLKQGEFCYDPKTNTCYYNHPYKRGVSCIFGLLFDEETRAFLEEGTPAAENLDDIKIREYLGLDEYWDDYEYSITDFFNCMQEIHDRAAEQSSDESIYPMADAPLYESFLYRLYHLHSQFPWLKPITV